MVFRRRFNRLVANVSGLNSYGLFLRCEQSDRGPCPPLLHVWISFFDAHCRLCVRYSELDQPTSDALEEPMTGRITRNYPRLKAILETVSRRRKAERDAG